MVIQLSWLFAAFSLMASTIGLAQTPDSEKKVITPKAFCGNLRTAVDGLMADKVAVKAVNTLLRDIKTGQLDEYIDLAKLTGSPTRDKKWIPTGDLLAIGLGLPNSSTILIQDVSELRFSNHLAKGSNLVVVTSDIHVLTPDHMVAVGEALRENAARLNVIYTGKLSNPDELSAIKGLSEIVATSNGQILIVPAGVTCPTTQK